MNRQKAVALAKYLARKNDEVYLIWQNLDYTTGITDHEVYRESEASTSGWTRDADIAVHPDGTVES